MPLAVLSDLLSRKVLDILPCVFRWSIPEPAELEHKAPVVIMPLSDKLVEDSLHRVLTRRREGWYTPCLKSAFPRRITLRRIRRQCGVVTVYGTDPIGTFDGETTAISLEYLIRPLRLDDEFTSLVLV